MLSKTISSRHVSSLFKLCASKTYNCSWMPTIRGSHQSRFIVESSLQSKNYTYVLPLTLFKYITFIWTLVQSLFYTVMFAVISLSLLYPWMIILSCRSEGITRCCAVSIRWAWRVCALHSVSKYASENIMYACETSLSVLNNWALLGIHKHRQIKIVCTARSYNFTLAML